ncbi:MAG: hypothetical protein AAF682_12290 [Planctomycetota bacterium]
MLHRTPAPLCAIALLGLGALASAQTVWTVDESGGGDFLDIQPAIDAAADGDVIVVEAGVYGPIHIDGKGLRLHATSTAMSIFNDPPAGVGGSAVTIENLAADQSVVIDGINVFSFLLTSPSVVRIERCDGPVWIHRAFVDAFGASALQVTASTSVVLDRAFFQTNLTTPDATGTPQPGAGARIEDGSRVFAYDSSFRGSHGPFLIEGAPAVTSAQDGGPGLHVIESEVRLTGGEAFGGSGSSLLAGGCTSGGFGGAGALLSGAGGPPPVLRFSGTAFFGGAAGQAEPCAPPVQPGAAIEAGPGTVIDTQQSARIVDVQGALLIPGDPVPLLVDGQPGDLVVVLATLGPAPSVSLPTGFPLGELDLHVTQTPLVPVFTATLTTSSLGASLTAPPLPPGIEVAVPALQTLVVDSTGFPHSGTPVGLTVYQP